MLKAPYPSCQPHARNSQIPHAAIWRSCLLGVAWLLKWKAKMEVRAMHERGRNTATASAFIFFGAGNTPRCGHNRFEFGALERPAFLGAPDTVIETAGERLHDLFSVCLSSLRDSMHCDCLPTAQTVGLFSVALRASRCTSFRFCSHGEFCRDQSVRAKENSP